jgi:integrase
VRLADLSPKEIYAWRQTIPEGHRFDATQALRQVLRRAAEWEWLSDNPAKCVPNPQRPSKEKRPFESWEEVGAVAAELRPVYGTMVIFAAATGLRPSELFGLEWRDVDRLAGVVYVRRAFANWRLKHPKRGSAIAPFRCRRKRSRRSTSCPRPRTRSFSQTPAADASTSAVSAAGSGSRRSSAPASSRSAASTTCATPHATFALRAGVPVFAVSRSMGSSIAMIDYHYGHLAHDSHEHAVSLLDALAIERAVDAGWTSRPRLVAPTANRNS